MNSQIDWKEVDIEQYLAEAQSYITKAINDPSSLQSRHLNRVAKTIVNRAWEDPGYWSTAAKLCSHICQVEQEQQREHDIPQYSFRGGVVEICQDLCQQWVEMRKANPAYWLAFCHFLAEVYQSIIVAGEPLKSLSNLLFAMLHNLLQPPCVLNFDEVEFLCSTFTEHGQQLERDDSSRMQSLVDAIRDAFLHPDFPLETRSMLLPLIELYGSQWELSKDAKKLYFSM